MRRNHYVPVGCRTVTYGTVSISAALLAVELCTTKDVSDEDNKHTSSTAHVPLARHICTSNPLRYEQLSFAFRQLQQLQCRPTRVILLFGSAWHPCGRTEIFVAFRAPSCPSSMRHVWCHRQMRSLPQRARGRRLVSTSLLRTLLNGGESPHQKTALSLPPVSHIPM